MYSTVRGFCLFGFGLCILILSCLNSYKFLCASAQALKLKSVGTSTVYARYDGAMKVIDNNNQHLVFSLFLPHPHATPN